jgi:O-acetyl-ADP-ribose deacetylase (regulator of RNase III)
MALIFLEGDATDPPGHGPQIIAHICNDQGGWGRGFVRAISARWPQPEAQYRAWHQSGTGFELGAVELVQVAPMLSVANMIAQHGYLRLSQRPPIRYQALGAALAQVAILAADRGASVHMPRIGCGLAGGDWPTVEAIIQAELVDHGVPVTVYDLPQS